MGKAWKRVVHWKRIKAANAAADAPVEKPAVPVEVVKPAPVVPEPEAALEPEPQKWTKVTPMKEAEPVTEEVEVEEKPKPKRGYKAKRRPVTKKKANK